jgi:nucleoside-diphosphate-sugar epimerase
LVGRGWLPNSFDTLEFIRTADDALPRASSLQSPVSSLMHCLVTGGGGFLGRYVCEQLVARGDRVRSFGRGAYPELEALGVEVARGDITDRRAVAEACAGAECVIHTAAVAGIAVGARARSHYIDVNVVGTRMVLQACQEHRVSRLVYTSSPSVTFAGVDQQGVDERQCGNPDWLASIDAHYSWTKAAAESAVLRFNSESETTRTCALRPHLIWGPRDAHLIPRLIDRARRGRLRRVGDGTNLVDICYVENAAAAHLAAADALADPKSPAAGRAYYISQGEPVNCWQWIDEVLGLAGLPQVKKSISFQAAWLLGVACEAAYRLLRLRGEPPMTRFLAAQLAKSHWYDISAARRDLGYETRVSTAEGMQRLAAWLNSSA